MALDHFIPQVHLRNFYAPSLGGKKMYAMRKSDSKRFPCGSEDVCRIENGSTNDFLLESRVIEEFIKPIERNYNSAIAKIKTGKIDADTIYVIAGFIAYIISCSPTAMRLFVDPLRGIVESTSALMDREGMLPPPPKELGGASLSELLKDGKVVVEIDKKYPQAIAISNIRRNILAFGNFDWDIFINEKASPFFTSDYPVAIERAPDPRIINRIIPLAPDLAVRIHPTLDFRRRRGDYSFRYFRFKKRELNHQEVRAINERLVRCAEEFIFYRDNHVWVEKFIEKNANFRIATSVEQFGDGNRTLQLSTLTMERLSRTDIQ